MNSILRTLLVFVLLAAAGFAQAPDFAEWRKKAEAGDADAQYNLGMKYLDGKGVPRDYTEAVNLLQSAAMQGDARAQFELGRMYNNGKGVQSSYIYAHVWWNLAAASGHQEAKSRLDFLETSMSTHSMAEAMKLARELFAKLPKGN
jgi:uncharacterized protein